MGRIKTVNDDDLLTTARDIFAAKGYGASTREIAKAAGISEGVLYQRFHTKLELFFAAMIPPPFDVIRRGDSSPAGDPAEDLILIAFQILAYFRQAMPLLLQLVTHPSFKLAELADGKAKLPLHDLGHAVSDSLIAARTRGVLAVSDKSIGTATMTLLATIHSMALFERMGIHGGALPDAVVTDIVKLILAGLANEKGVPA